MLEDGEITMDVLIYCESCRYHWSPPDHPVRPSHPVRKLGIVYTPGRGARNRSKELFKTGVPDEFKVELVKKVRIPENSPPEYWEEWILEFFEKQGLRTHARREHAIATLEEVKRVLDLVPGDYVDAEYVLENPDGPNVPVEIEDDSDDQDGEEEDEVYAAIGSQYWSVDGVRRFIEDEWPIGQVYKTEELYIRLVIYCQDHNLPYCPERDGLRKPHLNSLGGFLRKNFVGKGLSQERRGGNKAVWGKTPPTSRE